MSITETIVKVDDLFSYWNQNFKEIKRQVLGHYPKENESYNINERIYICNDQNDICSHKFNFLFPGNRCKMCNSLSLLTKNGDIKNKEIKIDFGKHKNKSIIVEQYHTDETEYGIIKPIKLNTEKLFECLSPVSFNNTDFYEKCKTYKNTSNDHSNYAIMASLFHEFGIENRFLYYYVCCNNINIVKLLPISVGGFDDIVLTNEYANSIIEYIFSSFSECDIVHGDNCIDYLSFDFKNSNLIIYIDPSNKTSFANEGYNKKKISLVSNDKFKETEFNNIKTGVYFTKDENYSNNNQSFIPVSPVIDNNDIYYNEFYYASTELFEFTEKTGINIFKTFQFYLWLLVLLCEDKFFKCVNVDNYKMFFFPEDLELLISKIKEQHNRRTTYRDIKDLMIDINLRLRFDFL